MRRLPGTASASLLAGLLLALGPALGATAEPVLVIRAGQVLTMAGPPLERGMVVVTGGRLTYVGPAAALPAGAQVIDAPAGVVMPGLVDANAGYGRRGDPNEQSRELTPDFSPQAALDRESPALQRALRLGVTTARLAPGNENVVGGHSVVVKTGGASLGDCVLRTGEEIKVVLGQEPAMGNAAPRRLRPDSFYYRQPTTPMGVVWILRQALAEAREALDRHQAPTPAQQPFADILRGRVPLHIVLRCAVDVETAFTLADEFGLKRLVFEDCAEGHKLAAEIGRRKVPTILGPLYTFPSGYPQSMEGKDLSWNNAGLLARAGVPVAIASNLPDQPADLLLWASWAARNGLPRELALQAVTSTPARLLGVGDRVGSLVRGHDADLLVLSGDPLALTSRLEQVILNGRIVFDAGSKSNGNK